MTSKVSHISLADSHCEILKNSLEFTTDVMIFLAMQSNLDFSLSSLVHWDHGFLVKDQTFSILGIKGPFSIASQIP